MLDVLTSLLISFIITLISIPVIIRVSDQKKLFDLPEARKVHKTAIASLGGLGIFAGFILAWLLSSSFSSSDKFQYLLAAILIIFFIGLKDDILIIAARKKLAAQVLAATILVIKGGFVIRDMHGFFGIFEISQFYGWILSIFTILVITNAFNLIDGVDTLAGSLGLMVTIILGAYFLMARSIPYASLSFCLSGSLLAFLMFNRSPSKIFMGDTGSLLVGLISSVLIIRFINMAPVNAFFTIETSPAVAFSIVVIPLLDTLRVFMIRIFNKKSPFKPDKNHLHHILLSKGFTHHQIALTLVAVNLLFIAWAYVTPGIGNSWSIVMMSAAFFLGLKLFKSFYKPISKNGKMAEKKSVFGTYRVIEEKKFEIANEVVIKES